MKKILLSMLVICSLLLMTACPSETAIRKSAKASFRLSGATRDLIAATRSAFEQNLISLETKDKAAGDLMLLAEGGKAFNNAVQEANRQQINGTLPANKMQILNLMFSDKVVAPFLRVLETFKVVSGTEAPALHAAIASVRLLILTVSQSFSAKNLTLIETGELPRWI